MTIETVSEEKLEETLSAISELALKHKESLKEHPVELYRKIWKVNKRSLSILKHKKSGEIFGYSICAPLKESFLQKIIKLRKDRAPIKENIKTTDLLNDSDAEKMVNSSGNILFISMSSWHNGRLDYQTGLPLFFNMEVRFYQLRARIILCESKQPIASQMIRASGCKIFYCSKSNEEIFYFDVGLLKQPESITTGLGVVLAHNWGPLGIFPLSLSPTQRFVAQGILKGIPEKNLAAYLEKEHKLKISTHTVHEHIKKIRRKAKDQLGIEDRAAIISYLALHQFELYPPLDEQKHNLLTHLFPN